MALSSEVQASIVKVAGDWALAITNKECPTINFKDSFSKHDFIIALKQNFDNEYRSLIDTVQE